MGAGQFTSALTAIVNTSQPAPLAIPPATEVLAQFAPRAAARNLIGQDKLRFAVAAQVLITGFYGTVARSDGHRAKLDTVIAPLAEIRFDAKGV
jgi:hypothetical protein